MASDQAEDPKGVDTATDEEDIDLDIEDGDDEGEAPKKEDKPEPRKETPEQAFARHQRQAARLAEKHGFKTDEPSKKKSDELGYAEKAFLYAAGIKTPDEMALAQKVSKESGKPLEQVLDSRYFQADLKDLRDSRVAEEAIPSGTKRSNNTSRDSVEYWLNKGEMPPADQPKLRREVVNARMKAATESSPFTENPVIR